MPVPLVCSGIEGICCRDDASDSVAGTEDSNACTTSVDVESRPSVFSCVSVGGERSMVDVAVRLFATRSENLTEAGSPVPFLGGSRVGLRPVASSRERGGKAAAQVVGGIPPACVNRASSVLRCRTLESRRGLLAGRSGHRSSSLSFDYLSATVKRCDIPTHHGPLLSYGALGGLRPLAGRDRVSQVWAFVHVDRTIWSESFHRLSAGYAWQIASIQQELRDLNRQLCHKYPGIRTAHFR